MMPTCLLGLSWVGGAGALDVDGTGCRCGNGEMGFCRS